LKPGYIQLLNIGYIYWFTFSSLWSIWFWWQFHQQS